MDLRMQLILTWLWCEAGDANLAQEALDVARLARERAGPIGPNRDRWARLPRQIAPWKDGPDDWDEED